jgi:branched-chain amino acid transport system permease protein
MTDILLFGILGLGTGAAYALISLGIVLVYKGSGVVNFAAGAMAGVAAIFYATQTGNGTPAWLAALMTIAGSGLFGLLLYAFIFRPLRKAPALAQVVATLGIWIALDGLAFKIWGSPSVIAPAIFPSGPVHLLGVSFGRDRLYMVALVAVLASGLWAAYRFTEFGIATRGAAESERSASLLGYSPDRLGAINWVLGAMMAAVAGIVIAPITTLDIDSLSILILPALAAALVGRFSSFFVAGGVALGIGILQSEILDHWSQVGVSDALPFVIVIVAMLLSGRLIPARGTLSLSRLPLALPSRWRPVRFAVLSVLTLLVIAVVSSTYRAAVTTSLITTVVALSIVVVTGFVGQISLMQMAFAGVSGFFTSVFAVNAGLPFPLPIVLATLVALPVGVLLGLPAVKIRGMALAVVTLGAAVSIDSVVFQNPSWTGGGLGKPVPSPSIFGLSLDPGAHPVVFGIFVLLVTLAMIATVSALRRSPSGRRMLAVRSNERAASAIGINVPMAKLQAFALSAMLAGLSGSLLSYQLGNVAFDRFGPIDSLTIVAFVYIGGIATVSGAVVAGIIVNGGILFVLLQNIGGIASWWTVLSGVLLVATAVTQPDGVSVAMGQQLAWVRKRLPFSFGSGSDSGSGSNSQFDSRQHQLAGVPVSSGEPPGPDLAERTPTAARHGDD